MATLLCCTLKRQNVEQFFSFRERGDWEQGFCLAGKTPLVSHLQVRYASKVPQIRSRYLNPETPRPFSFIQGSTLTLPTVHEQYARGIVLRPPCPTAPCAPTRDADFINRQIRRSALSFDRLNSTSGTLAVSQTDSEKVSVCLSVCPSDEGHSNSMVTYDGQISLETATPMQHASDRSPRGGDRRGPSQTSSGALCVESSESTSSIPQQGDGSSSSNRSPEASGKIVCQLYIFEGSRVG